MSLWALFRSPRFYVRGWAAPVPRIPAFHPRRLVSLCLCQNAVPAAPSTLEPSVQQAGMRDPSQILPDPAQAPLLWAPFLKSLFIVAPAFSVFPSRQTTITGPCFTSECFECFGPCDPRALHTVYVQRISLVFYYQCWSAFLKPKGGETTPLAPLIRGVFLCHPPSSATDSVTGTGRKIGALVK